MAARRKRSGRGLFRGYLVAGFLVLAPLGFTIWFLRFLVRSADALLTIHRGHFFYVIPETYHPDNLLGFHVPGLGILLTLIIVPLVGMVAKNFLGKRPIKAGEQLLGRIPVLRSIYNAIKQLMETLLDEESKNFKQVVLIPYPHKDCYSIAFLTGESFTLAQKGRKQRLLSIFIATVPNPTTGFFLLVPEEDVVFLEMSVEEAFKLVMSFGIIAPANRQLSMAS